MEGNVKKRYLIYFIPDYCPLMTDLCPTWEMMVWWNPWCRIIRLQLSRNLSSMGSCFRFVGPAYWGHTSSPPRLDLGIFLLEKHGPAALCGCASSADGSRPCHLQSFRYWKPENSLLQLIDCLIGFDEVWDSEWANFAWWRSNHCVICSLGNHMSMETPNVLLMIVATSNFWYKEKSITIRFLLLCPL